MGGGGGGQRTVGDSGPTRGVCGIYVALRQNRTGTKYRIHRYTCRTLLSLNVLVSLQTLLLCPFSKSFFKTSNRRAMFLHSFHDLFIYPIFTRIYKRHMLIYT